MPRFDYFVVLAEMRTGSNFLEANINQFDDLSCHGEAFNPFFIGFPDSTEVLGVDQVTRDANPQTLIDRIKAQDGLAGFRFFNDHDERALEIFLTDPRCAKIVLTRNPLDSFVSWKIAQATGQWKLTNINKVRSEQISFSAEEFETYVAGLQGFQVRVLNTLQRTGQTAFYVAYEDLQDVSVMNGLAQYLGSEARIKALDKSLKKQNPAPMSSKVENFDEMSQTLARLDRFNLNRTPDFEPRRGPMVPSYVAAPETGLLYLPLKSGPTEAICDWLARLDGKEPSALRRNFTQKSLREWMQARVGHRSFTVLRHPVAWAHTAFCVRLLGHGDGSFPEVRKSLRKMHGVDIPDSEPVPETDPTYTLEVHRTAFLGFLKFLRNNLSAQTAIRVDPSWGTQLSVLQGMAEFGLPDMIVREDELTRDLAILAAQLGKSTMPPVPRTTDPLQVRLAAIYDKEIEAAARTAYQKDYVSFGFGDWSPL